jgi:hypothetical protein
VQAFQRRACEQSAVKERDPPECVCARRSILRVSVERSEEEWNKNFPLITPAGDHAIAVTVAEEAAISVEPAFGFEE